MGLLRALKNRLFPPTLCRVARRGDSVATADCIASTALVVIGADLGESVPFDADQGSVTAVIEAAARKKTFDGSIHKYELDGKTFLPLFTDTATAESFCGAYCGLLGHVHAFRLFKVPGTYIRHWIADDDIIIVNPQYNNEVELKPNQSSEIRDRLPVTNTFHDAKIVSVTVPMLGISRPIEFRPDA
jgi:hypothetical protein